MTASKVLSHLAHDGEDREAKASTRPTNGWQGTVLSGTYRVSKRLGKGGMGEVYEAEHLRVGKSVAVKFMSRDAVGDRRALERFRREVRALSAITSEHVVSVLDCGEIDGETPYIVMERLDGEDLRHLLAKEGRLSVYRTLRFALDACAGLSAVHAVGLVHRDLKPANLFVTRSKTRGELCKILDFGVAKGQTSEVTSQGALLGTVRYMAPEQLSNSASVSASTDVYAVGAILFECLAGRPAHDAETPEELMFDILNRDPPLASELRPELSPELADVIACAMARRQNERYESVGELALELERLLPAKDSEETAHDLSQPVRRPPRSRRRVSRTNVVVAAAVAGGVAAGFSFAKLGEPGVSSVESPPCVTVPEARSPVAPAQAPARSVEPQTIVASQPALGSHANPAGKVLETPPGAVPIRNSPARATNSLGGKSRAQKDGAALVGSAPAAEESRPQGPVVLDVKNPYEE